MKFFILSADDEEFSLVMEPACNVVGTPAEGNYATGAVDDDTLSVGPDMPDLPLDAPSETDTSIPAQTNEEVPPAEQQEDSRAAQAEQGRVGEESTVRDEASTSPPELEQEEGGSPEQQEDTQEEEQGGEPVPQTEEESKEFEGAAQPESESEHPTTTVTNVGAAAAVEAPSEEGTTQQEDSAPGAQQEAIEEGETSCKPCSCQSLFSNCNTQAPSRRKTRPCSLPVSELETVIASACGEPETPRSHYIRIHHLLHSLPSARPPNQEEEGEVTNTNAMSPTLKSSKEEEEEEEDTTQSPSQVRECPGPCCRRSLPRSLSIERLSELNQLLEGEGGQGEHAVVRRISPSCLDSEEGDSNLGGGRRLHGTTHRPPGENECEFCDTSCYSTSCYSTSCYSTSCYSNSGYEGRGRFCSHNRLSSVDSNRLSGSTVFSSQDEEEDEESAFESVPDPVEPEGQDSGGAGGERRMGRKEARRGEQGEPAVAGPSDKNCIGSDLSPPVGHLPVLRPSHDPNHFPAATDQALPPSKNSEPVLLLWSLILPSQCAGSVPAACVSGLLHLLCVCYHSLYVFSSFIVL
ncbi:hypothetical protein XENOCAPTIV_013895 [Xenoophorus captivus]|uniref:Uncharacterized protein n=1 Tax=Xenoophorus captivus TaxID=1517983 RepID=A0ABV0S0U0_9TELE